MYDQEMVIAKFKKQADDKRIDEQLEAALLDEIRKGDRDAIVKLVDSWEYVVIKVIGTEIKRQIYKPSVIIEKLFNVGRSALITMAESELNSTVRERFFRFSVWCVRQAIITELDY